MPGPFATYPDTFTSWLRAANQDAWDAMVGHRFCRDMASDIPQDVLVRYLRYEHAFVRAAITIFAHALTKAPAADQTRLVAVLHALATEQEDYFRDTFAALGLGADLLPEDALPPGARGLRDGVLGIATQHGYAEILSSILAAEWMYWTWCSEAKSHGKPKQTLAAAWIDLHVEPDFSDQVAWLRNRVDALGPKLPPERQVLCAKLFARVLKLEIAFHDAPYRPL
ncbi:MAG: TenA family protein [Pseudomonadota bacterium]